MNGTENVLSRNVAADNGDDGFDLDGERNRLTRNEAHKNGAIGEPGNRNGFHVSNDFNALTGNVATENAEFGFVIDDGIFGNSITNRNISELNGSTDMHDLNAECSSNRWRQNIFGTSDPGCID